MGKRDNALKRCSTVAGMRAKNFGPAGYHDAYDTKKVKQTLSRRGCR